ncbi:MAG TPA: hypothetical protein VF023_09920 [Bryobacteraceae bacterium]|jgi:hypothetical protein
MRLGAKTESLLHKQIRGVIIAVLFMISGAAFLSLSTVRPKYAVMPPSVYNGAVESQPDIVLMKTTYCVAGPQNPEILAEVHRAVDRNDQASFNDLYTHHGLLTLYPGNVIKPLSAIKNDGTQFVELPQPVAGYVTCWLLGNTIE